MPRGDYYNFVKIRDAIDSATEKVNVIGVVLECGFPRKTKGTDWFCSVRIIDETHQDSGLAVNVFTQTRNQLPRILSPGDIIQFQRVSMKVHDDKVNAVFNKKYSSFAIYEGRDGGNCAPYQTYYTFREKDLDKNLVLDLRRWLQNFQFHEGANYFSLVREIKEGESFNLVCKILHVHEGAGNEWMAFVWDGTDAPPANILQRLEDEMHHPLPLHLESLPLPRDTLCSFPSVGTVLRVISQDIEGDDLLLLKAGEWVKLVNLLCEVHAGLWRCVLTPFTKRRYTSTEDCLKLDRKRLYDERLAQSPESIRRMPYWSFPQPSQVTVVDDDEDHATFLTLMDVLTCSEVKASFKCVVRVVAVLPWEAKDFCFPAGLERIRLTLEDPTARIHAFLYAEDGLKFFDGQSPVKALERKRNALLGLNDGEENGTRRNPPWVQVCLKSESVESGSMQHRIFGTKLSSLEGVLQILC